MSPRDAASFVLGLGTRVGGADRRGSGPPRRAPVEALRRRHHAGAGARPGRRRAAPGPHPGAGRARRVLHHRDVGAGVPLPRRPLHRPHRRVQPPLPQPDRRRGPPALRGRARRRPRLVLVERREGGALRRRVVRGVGREPARGRRRRDRGHGPVRPGPRARRRLAGRPHPGRRSTAPQLEDQLRPAGVHAAPLPAELPLLDARRLDRHPLRRPLRHQPHPHRRLRGVGAHAHAAGLVGEPPAARLGRRAEPRPDGDRQRGHPRRHHRGLDADPAPARRSGPRPASCSRPGRPARTRSARSCRPSCGRPTAASSTRSRPAAPPGSTARSRS